MTHRRTRGLGLMPRLLAAVLLALLASCAHDRTAVTPRRILFIGNSVLYTNNLPAIFGRMADAQQAGPAYRVDMVARGGASLSQWAGDERLLASITSGRYDAVVLQERGGDDLCVLDAQDRQTPACQALIDGHVRLARLAREHGARVFYLGTYQQVPEISAALVRAESTLGTQMQAQYVEVSERLRALRALRPDLPWLYSDNAHPGMAMTALMGVLLYEALGGSAPVPSELCTGAELYTPQWKHDGVAVHAQLVANVQPSRCLLDAAQMQVIVQAASDHRDKQ